MTLLSAPGLQTPPMASYGSYLNFGSVILYTLGPPPPKSDETSPGPAVRAPEAQKPRQRVSIANQKIFTRPENFYAYVIKGTILSGRFQNCPYSFKTDRTVSKMSGRFQNCPDGFKTVRTVLKMSGRFQKCLDSFKTVWTVSKLSGQFQNCPDSFKTVSPVSKLSGRCQNCPDSFKN